MFSFLPILHAYFRLHLSSAARAQATVAHVTALLAELDALGAAVAEEPRLRAMLTTTAERTREVEARVAELDGDSTSGGGSGSADEHAASGAADGMTGVTTSEKGAKKSGAGARAQKSADDQASKSAAAATTKPKSTATTATMVAKAKVRFTLGDLRAAHERLTGADVCHVEGAAADRVRDLLESTENWTEAATVCCVGV